MATYRGKLVDQDRLVAGIQAAVYIPGGNKVDTDVTDEFGYFQFNNLTPGQYEVYFYGGGYIEEDYITIFVTDRDSNTQFFIRPTSGTVIKNSVGSLTVELREIFAGDITVPTDGPIKLYVNNGGTFELLSAQTGVTAIDDYTATVGAAAINGTLDIYAVADANEVNEFIYDTITLADVTDGVGFIGWVTPSSFVAIDEGSGIFDPATITLEPNFAFDGQEIDLVNDAGFTFDSITPSTDLANGIDVDSSSGLITITTADYFDEQNILTLTWDATYTQSGNSYVFSVTETIYKATAGADAKTFRISASSFIFKSDQDDVITSPNEITLTGLKQNVPESPKWEVLQGSVTLVDSGNTPITENSTEVDTVKITSSNMGSNTVVKVRGYIDANASSGYNTGELFDQVTIARVKEGSNA